MGVEPGTPLDKETSRNYFSVSPLYFAATVIINSLKAFAACESGKRMLSRQERNKCRPSAYVWLTRPVSDAATACVGLYLFSANKTSCATCHLSTGKKPTDLAHIKQLQQFGL